VVLANPPLPVPLRPAERVAAQTLGRLAVAVGPTLLRVLIRRWGRRMIDTKLAYLQGGTVPEWFAGLGGNLAQIPSDTMAVWTEELAGLRSHPETLGYAATAFASVMSGIVVDQRPVWDAIDRLAAPVLLLWGEEDPLLARPVIDAVLARRPDWDLHVFAGAGHAAPVERPDEYAAAVHRWLTDSSSSAPGDGRAGTAEGRRGPAPRGPVG
jgi:pimeloyl-ACP methyl ester carboxylesterase